MQLDFITACDVRVTSADSDFLCDVSDGESGGISIAIIAGAAGGGVLIGLLLLICLVMLAIFRSKQRKKRV